MVNNAIYASTENERVMIEMADIIEKITLIALLKHDNNACASRIACSTLDIASGLSSISTGYSYSF